MLHKSADFTETSSAKYRGGGNFPQSRESSLPVDALTETQIVSEDGDRSLSAPQYATDALKKSSEVFTVPSVSEIFPPKLSTDEPPVVLRGGTGTQGVRAVMDELDLSGKRKGFKLIFFF